MSGEEGSKDGGPGGGEQQADMTVAIEEIASNVIAFSRALVSKSGELSPLPNAQTHAVETRNARYKEREHGVRCQVSCCAKSL